MWYGAEAGNNLRAAELKELKRGASVLHGMLFPGVYPSNEVIHKQLLKTGTEFRPRDYPFFRFVDGLAEGIDLRWFRVLPPVGMNGYSENDVAVMRRINQATANSRFEPRETTLDDALLERLQRQCGGTVLEQYLRAVEDGNPRNSFWSMRARRDLGFVGLMRYRDKKYAGMMIYQQSIPRPVSNWVEFWEDEYKNASPYIA